MGPKMAVLTGVWLQEGSPGHRLLRRSQVGEAKLFLTDRIEGFYHGTGDLFASALLGGLLNGMSLKAACETWPRSLPGAPSKPLLKSARITALAPSSSATCPGWGKRWKRVEKLLQILWIYGKMS